MMAFDGTGSDATPIGTFSSDLKGMGKAIDTKIITFINVRQ